MSDLAVAPRVAPGYGGRRTLCENRRARDLPKDHDGCVMKRDGSYHGGMIPGDERRITAMGQFYCGEDVS